MNRNFKTSSVTEAAMMTGLLVIIAYLSSFISIFMFFYPTPAIILGKRKGLKYSTLALIASDIIISMLLGLQTGLMFLIMYTPLALALTFGVCKDEDANKTILLGSAAYMISFLVFILALRAVMGINFIEEVTEMYDQSFEMMKDILETLPDGGSSDQMEQAIRSIEETMPMMNRIITNVFPALIIVASIATSYLNYFVASKFANHFSLNVRQLGAISYFSFPKNFMVAMAGLLILSFLLGALNIDIGVIQLNLFIIVFMAMLLQGFLVLKFYIDKSSLGKFAKTLMLFIVIIMSFKFSVFYAILGLIDLTVNLRKIERAV